MEKFIIEKVRSHEILYNVKSSYYRDPNMRQEAWYEIGRDLNMAPEAVKNDWEKLRRCYLNALNRRRTKNGDLAQNKTPWKYQAEMSFLIPFLQSKAFQADVDAEDVEDSVEDFDISFKIDNTEEEDKAIIIVDGNSKKESVSNCNGKPLTHVQKSKKRKLVGCNNSIKNINVMKGNVALRKRKCSERSTNAPTTGDMDETDMFFMSMSKIAKMLPAVDQAKIKLQLSNAVLSAQIKMAENGHYNS